MRCAHNLALLVVLLLSSPIWAQPAPAEPSDPLKTEVELLRRRVSEQEGRLQQLTRNQDTEWLNERRVEEVKQLIREVLSDADTRASLLDEKILAGHNGKAFFMSSADGNYLMTVSGYLQLRYIANSRHGAALPDPDDEEMGFQLRRVKVKFEGHVISPRLGYIVQIETNRDTAVLDIDHVAVNYKLTDDLKLEFGRFKGPFLREEAVIGATRQLAVERSLVNAVFSANYVEGLRLEWRASELAILNLSVNDGRRSGDAGGAGNDFQNDSSDVALTGRLDLKLAGDWEQIKQFSAVGEDAMALFAGAAVHYEMGESGDDQTASPGVDEFLVWTVDAHFKTGGLSVSGAFIGQHVQVTDAAATGDLTDLGAMAQVAYLVIPDKFEPFLRYEWISPDDDRGEGEMNLVTAGFNWYFRKHAAKFTLDAIWALDPLNAFAFSTVTSRTGLGLLPDAGEDDQMAVRAQFQLLF